MNHKIHKYNRKRFPNKTVYYKCVLPGCTHYLFEDLIWNKIMICNQCGDDFILTKRKQNQAKPKCLSCTGRKDERVESLIEGLF